jgi:hypothetical protein|tara:strand:+ start:75 stop:887 length:813 start_codon:yes stop_codon:yes gene_type:complete
MMHDYFPELDGNQSIDNGKLGREFHKGGGGGGSQQTTQSIDPAILPYITYGLEEAQDLYQDGAPAYYPGQTYIDPSAQTTSALSGIEERATAGSPLLPAAQAQQQSSIEGDYLSAGNPYFASMMSNAARPAVTEFNKAIRDIGSRTAGAGRYGSGAMGEMEGIASKNLADSLSNRASELAFNNYSQERGFQNNAVQNAPQLAQADYADMNQLANVGRTQEDYSRQALQGDISRFEYGANAPQQQLGNYLAAAYGAPAPVNSTSTSSGGGK